MPANLHDRYDWFDLWLSDRRAMADTMRSNMAADLTAGYNPNGISITRQKLDLHDYELETDLQMERFKLMPETEVERWCFYDMKKHGAIA